MAHDSHGHGPVDDPNFVNDKPYETRDISPGSVLKALFVLFAFVGVSSVITWGIFRIMVPVNDERTSAFPLPRVQVVPPEPRLQANPILEIKTFREQEQAATTSYGVDPKTRDLHIPIDRALEILAQEGLPTRQNPGVPNPQEPNEPSYTQGEAPPGTPTTLPDLRTLQNARPRANRPPGASRPPISDAGSVTNTPQTPSNASGTIDEPASQPNGSGSSGGNGRRPY